MLTPAQLLQVRTLRSKIPGPEKALFPQARVEQARVEQARVKQARVKQARVKQARVEQAPQKKSMITSSTR